jgi:antitoxin component YwqK of YwqJK toxin-antitoxin module
VIFEEAIKKLPFMLREMVVHVSLKACFQKPVSATRPFFDIYEGKLKHQIEIESDQLQGVARCYDENEEIIKNKNLSQVIAKACQIIQSKELF